MSKNKTKGVMNKKEHNNAKTNDFLSDIGIEPELTEQIESLFNSTKKGDEFEFIFFNRKGKYLTQEMYSNLLKYFAHRADDDVNIMTGPIDTLDLLYNLSDSIVIRGSIKGHDNINSYLKKLSLLKNHVIFSSLVKLWLKGDKNIHFMKKIKTQSKTVDIDDLDLRARLSKESELTKEEINIIKNLDETNINKITYRLKQRTSLLVYGSIDTTYIQIDLTYTKTTNDYKKLNSTVSNHELEVEYGTNETKSNDTTKLYAKMMEEIEILTKIVQQSNYIITNTHASKILDAYANILSLENVGKADSKHIKLHGRQPISLEIQYISELPNRYAVTDKADGERYFLIIHELNVYLISNNLHVKNIGLKLDANKGKYNGTLLDGEYIFIEEHNRHMFLVFDCLFFGKLDVRKEQKLFSRLGYADEVIEKCFIFEGQKGFKSSEKQMTAKFNIDEYIDFYHGELVKYMGALNTDSKIATKYPLIRRKYFTKCEGAKDWEIFAYSALIWSAYTNDPKIRCPYLLDGLIFQPLEQVYTVNKQDNQKNDYKWKPQNKNSIDFYVMFEKDNDTGKILTVYDNSRDDYVKNKPYKICNLHVGQKLSNFAHEQPVLFKSDQSLHLAHLFLVDGEARDIDGNILMDETVVEFYYNNNPDVPQEFKWVPIRTRFDKTEAVKRYRKQYGNYITTADKVWRSITNPLLMSDFEDLAKGNNSDKGMFLYDKKLGSIKQKISHELIVSAAKENAYYQKKNDIAQEMRDYHNFIKSNIIYTIYSPVYQNNKQLSVLDIGVGRGGDISKYNYAKTAFVVGIDIDLYGIIHPYDGAISRYEKQRTKQAGWPKMHFFQADAGSLLNYNDQYRVLNGMSETNKELIKQFFPNDESKRTRFDRINCSFSIHYMFKDTTTWSNFKTNVNNHLRAGGYLTATTFDGRKVIKLLADKDNYSHEYTNREGQKTTLYDIVKRYNITNLDENTIVGTGQGIEVFMSWIASIEKTYIPEYLVDPKFIEKELFDDCDLELVDTDTFDKLKNITEEFSKKYGMLFKDVPMLGRLGKFYNPTEINKGCHVYNSLMRYYIFRKKDKSINKQKGGSNDSVETLNFSDSTKFAVGKMSEYNNSYSCFSAIHQLLKSHKIIPKHITPEEMFGDFKIDLKDDKSINISELNNAGKKIIIEHSNEDGTEILPVINGLNIFVVERNCNDDYDVDVQLINNKKTNSSKDKAIILMKEGDLYVPMYQIQEDGRKRGIFKMNDTLIKQMIE